jgi:WD40 repeat protein
MAPWKRAALVVAVVLAGLAVWAARLALGESPIATLRGHAAPVTAVAFAADGRTVASGDNEGSVKLWDAETGAERTSLKLGDGAVTGLSFRGDGKYLAGAGFVPAAKIWDAGTGKEDRELPLDALTVAFAPDNKMLAVAGQLGALLLWDSVGNKEWIVKSRKGHIFRSAAFSRSGKVLVTGTSTASAGEFGEVRLWSGSMAKPLKTMQGDPRHVSCVAISPDGKTVASVGEETGARLWDVEAGTVMFELMGPPVRAVAFRPDGKTVATVGPDGAVRLWDVGKGKERKKWRAHAGGVAAVAFSADGKRLVTGGGDGLVKVWAVE